MLGVVPVGLVVLGVVLVLGVASGVVGLVDVLGDDVVDVAVLVLF